MAEQRLIDANAILYVEAVDGDTFEGTGKLYAQKKDIDALPTIEERKTGFWCVTPDGKLVCSNCYNNPTNRIIVDGSLIYDMTPIKRRMRYCPNCGSYNGGAEHDAD